MANYNTSSGNHTFNDEIRVDELKDNAGTGAPDLTNGVTIGGTSNATLDSYEEQVIASMGGNFTAGGAKIVKIGSQVTITGDQAWTHSSSNTASSTTGVVNTQFRPSTTIFGCYLVTTGVLCRISIDTAGTVTTRYFDFAGSDSSQVDTVSVPTFSYTIT